MIVEILLAEIGSQPSGERGDFGREGYTLAAGFALGLTTLGLGDNAIGLADLKIKERLRRYSIGGSAHAKGFSGNYGGANGPTLRKTSNYYTDGSSGGGSEQCATWAVGERALCGSPGAACEPPGPCGGARRQWEDVC